MNERDVILRERAAFEAGARFHYEQDCDRTRLRRLPHDHSIDYNAVSREAERRYTTMVTRPRTVNDPHAPQCHWKVIGGFLAVRCGGACGTFQNYPRPGEGMFPTPERCNLWASLLENPTEEVEAE